MLSGKCSTIGEISCLLPPAHFRNGAAALLFFVTFFELPFTKYLSRKLITFGQVVQVLWPVCFVKDVCSVVLQETAGSLCRLLGCNHRRNMLCPGLTHRVSLQPTPMALYRWEPEFCLPIIAADLPACRQVENIKLNLRTKVEIYSSSPNHIWDLQ